MKVKPVCRLPYVGRVNEDVLCRRIAVLTSMERARRGLLPLQPSPALADVARLHSANMSQTGFFDHVDPAGRSPQDRLSDRHPELIASVGENIARMPADPDDVLAAAFVREWMDSPGHRAAILDPEFTHLGVGAARHGLHVDATQLFARIDAQLLGPVPPLILPSAQGIDLTLAWVSPVPIADALVWVTSAHPLGCQSGFALSPARRGATLVVRFPPRQTPATYRLHVASRQTGRCSAGSLVVTVR